MVDLVLDLLAVEADSGDPTGDAWVVAVVDKVVEVEPRWDTHIPALFFGTLCPFAWLPPKGEMRVAGISIWANRYLNFLSSAFWLECLSAYKI